MLAAIADTAFALLAAALTSAVGFLEVSVSALLPLSTLMFALFIGWIWTRPGQNEAAGLHGWLGIVWFRLVQLAVPPVVLGLPAAAMLAS